MKKRQISVRKTSLAGSSDNGYLAGTMAERMDLAWKLSEEIWFIAQGKNAQQRLQRDVAVLTRRKR